MNDIIDVEPNSDGVYVVKDDETVHATTPYACNYNEYGQHKKTQTTHYNKKQAKLAAALNNSKYMNNKEKEIEKVKKTLDGFLLVYGLYKQTRRLLK